MYKKSHTCAGIVRYLLFGVLLMVGVQTTHAATSPQNTFGLSVDYTADAADGTLQVKLSDAISGAGMAGVTIIAREIRADGLSYPAGRQSTDSNGSTTFALDQLGIGGRYYLMAVVWHGQQIYTRTLTKPGSIVWKTGRVRVRVENATLKKPAPLANYAVDLRRSSLGWAKQFTTNSKGILRLDPPGLEDGIGYEFMANSPLSGNRKISDPISTTGTYTFRVGNRPLTVTLRQGATTVLAGRTISVLERLPDGSEARVTTGTTSNAGRIVFELDNLARGSRYILRVNPFDIGLMTSEPVATTGGYTFQVGNTPVVLIDEASGKKLSGKNLVAFALAEGSSTRWYASGQTNADGVAFFDFPETKSGTIFGIRVDNPLGNDERFFSKLIRKEGTLQFRVRKNTSERLDRSDPQVSIISPSSGKAAAAGGFIVQGSASDNRKIDQVMIEVRSGGKKSRARAEYNPDNERWSFYVTPGMLAGGDKVVLVAIAIDTTNNRQATAVTYPVIKDEQGPNIKLLSYQEGGTVPTQGFTLKGTVADNVAVRRLRIQVEDLSGNKLVQTEELEIAPGHQRWAHNLFPRRWGNAWLVRILVTASDDSGNQQEITIIVAPEAGRQKHHRMVDRITFGATPLLVQEATNMGWNDFLEMQLAPELIDDSALDRILVPVDEISEGELVWRTLQRMLYSERQLLELMTWFWDNHFNTDVEASRSVFEYNENQAFRKHALGRFRDLLDVSAKSPAMMRFLDGASSNKRKPNENYAREVMELHTLGVNGGYTQGDIEELARVFTGWQVRDQSFYFNENVHDPDDKQFLGILIAGNGVSEGAQALDILASHPSTARFICTKLIRFFVSDPADPGLITSCANTFSSTDGDISAVLRNILKSQSFYASVVKNTHFKSPLRFTTSVVRKLGLTNANRFTLQRALESMGMNLYHNPVPIGWPISGDSWINANQLIQRANLLFDLFDNLRKQEGFSLLDKAEAGNNVTGAGVLGMLMDDFFARRMTYTEYREAFIKLNDPDVFSIDTVDAEDRLRHVLRTMLVFPASHIY